MMLSLSIGFCLLAASVGLPPTAEEKRVIRASGNCALEADRWGATSGSISVPCRYPKAKEPEVKRLCKEAEGGVCTEVISATSSGCTIMDRYELTDDIERGEFVVTLSRLSSRDAGVYRCVTWDPKDDATTCLAAFNLRIPKKEEVYAVGKSAYISCPYEDEGAEKFLCRTAGARGCERVVHDKEKLLMNDNQRKSYFYFYILKLSPADTGAYWCCSSARTKCEGNPQILLFVDEQETRSLDPLVTDPMDDDNCHMTSVTMSPHASALSSSWVLGVVMAVATLAVTLALASVVLIWCRTRLCGDRGCPSQHMAHAGHDTEGDRHMDEGLHYTSVTFQKAASATATDKGGLLQTDSLDSHYAVINFKPTEEPLSLEV